MSDLHNTILVTLAILTGSFFSYLLQFFLGRQLSVADFGSFNTLLAMSAVISVPASVIGTALIKEVSSLYAKKEQAKLSALFLQSLIWSVALGTILFGFFGIFKDSIFGGLHLAQNDLILAFSIFIALTFVTVIPYSYLQGLLQYKPYALLIVITNVLRFVLPMLLLLQTKNLSHIFLGLILALVVSVLFGLWLLRPHIVRVTDFGAWKELLFIIQFSLPVMVINLCLISFNNSDLILVRSYLGSQMSGYYAGVVTVGKILLFGTMPVATVMYPKISALKSGGTNVNRVFKKFLNMQLAVVSVGLVIFALFPKLIALAFFGNKYLESVKYLPLYALFVALYVMLNFLILFLLAVDATKIYYTMMVLAVAQVILLTRFHSGIYQVIAINVALLFVAVGYVSYCSWRFLKSQA
jgi:O-antigen/teichoic acid export membrane protein